MTPPLRQTGHQLYMYALCWTRLAGSSLIPREQFPRSILRGGSLRGRYVETAPWKTQLKTQDNFIKHICSPEDELLNTEAVLKATRKKPNLSINHHCAIYNQRAEKEK